MGKKISILLVVVVMGMLLVPALASATLVNEYGMHFAGQAACVDCHSKFDPSNSLYIQPAMHGRFATSGISPGAPAAWTAFQAPGAVAPVAGEQPEHVRGRRQLQHHRPRLGHTRRRQ